MTNFLKVSVISASFQLRSCGPITALCFLFLLTFGAYALNAAQKAKPPEQAESIYAQGMQALQHGDLFGAQAAFERVLRLAPSSAEAHNSLGWVLLAEEKI